MRLLIVEDEPDLASLLRETLVRAGFAVDVAADLRTASAYCAEGGHDAVVLDRALPDGEGLKWLIARRQEGDGVPVLILTARDSARDRIEGLDGGADDYLVKPFHMDELVSRLRALLRRPRAALGVTLSLGDVELDTSLRETSVRGQVLNLALRETALLELLLRRSGRVVPREALEQGLYGLDSPATPNAMEVLVHRLRRRLVEAGAGVEIHTIRGVGYLLTTAQA